MLKRKEVAMELLQIPGRQWGKGVCYRASSLRRVTQPLPFLSASPSGDHQVLNKLKSWGFWLCYLEGTAYSILLGKKNQIGTVTDLPDSPR